MLFQKITYNAIDNSHVSRGVHIAGSITIEVWQKVGENSIKFLVLKEGREITNKRKNFGILSQSRFSFRTEEEALAALKVLKCLL